MRVNEVKPNKSPASLEKGLYGADAKNTVIVNVRAENSKTGYGRAIPVVLKASYNEIIKIQNALGVICNLMIICL